MRPSARPKLRNEPHDRHEVSGASLKRWIDRSIGFARAVHGIEAATAIASRLACAMPRGR